MKMFRRSVLRELGRDKSGGVLIEAGLVFPFLMLVFFGCAELAQYIDVTDRLTRVANQTAMVVSGVRVVSAGANDISNELPAYLNNARAAAQPHGVTLSMAPCGWPTGTVWPIANPYSMNLGPNSASGPTNTCGYGTGASIAAPNASCAGFPSPPYSISVRASCTYQPLFSVLGLFRGGAGNTLRRGFIVSRQVVIPMQFMN